MNKGTNGCMYNCGDSCTGECMKPGGESISKKEKFVDWIEHMLLNQEIADYNIKPKFDGEGNILSYAIMVQPKKATQKIEIPITILPTRKKVMDNEKFNQIIDEAYKKYADSHWTPPSNPKGKLLSDQLFSLVPMEHSKEEFINKCKTDSEFSERWGLKIEERELNFMERLSLYNVKMDGRVIGNHIKTEKDFDYENIPTKLITLTYNNETIESYE